MSAVGAFIPILFIFLIIWGIFYIIQSKNKNQLSQKHKKQRFYLSNKRIFWMVISYMLILILAAGIYAFIPQKQIPVKEHVGEDGYNMIADQLYNAAVNGEIEKIDPSFATNKWEKKFQEKQLNITTTNPDKLNTTVVVERKKTNDRRIEGVYYKTTSNIDGIDITDKIPLDHLKWSKDTLFLVPAEPIKFSYLLFDKDATLRQFTKEPSIRDGGFDSDFGSNILYLRIPKSLKIIESEEIGIQYVGDSN
ncbi:hypothetical protein MXL46_12810 [Heyndrickxia sporothermodurans]|uniref:hypothetical protein n=1 Tax=Heyndrickxia sporothermodurans TaxID=46224 RepID=UPI002DBE09B4|nr:hypothetical protein [Heyndrickxia sporothermodurans]MEB6549968.1 hypothetical protein [Heyndrickxia sporothermodurans]MED3651678.1 hypothetical protein [Heyndrickxia sporothermodurans]MED3653891.1 hypothetical protein [Heyndrickxia sporothermodurans]MED3699369.1 hypothetical protein [Heyndrickxia sporothermodurans]MED3779904.1 hypothetical protein [Heyndrickxia sporothermodurans]